MPIRKAFVSIVLSLVVANAVFGEIDVEHGNVTVTITDVAFSGGLEPSVARVYNSRSDFKGIFGLGWGLEYEVYLTVTGYGPVIVHNYGGGRKDYLFPENWTATTTAGLIIEAAQKSQSITTPEGVNQLRQKLLRDIAFLDQEWNKYAAKGLLTRTDLALGAKVSSSMYGYKELTRVPRGFVLKSDTDRVDTFNEKGRLNRTEDTNQNFIEFTFDENGNHSLIKDNFGRQIDLTYDNGLVTKIVASGGALAARTVTYKYNSAGALILSIGTDGKSTKYDYVGTQLSKIQYADNTTAEMTYFGVDNKRRVKTFKAQDRIRTSYEYPPVPADVDRSIVEEVRASQAVSRRRYEYFIKSQPTAERWMWKKIEVADGVTTNTEYDEHCGCPLIIKTPKGMARFEYDDKGRVRKKETPTEIVERTIDAAVGRVLHVRRYPPAQPTKAAWATFRYDAKGNLISAEDSNKKRLTITRDSFGRIIGMVNATKDQIQFTYDVDSKTKEIQVDGLGTLSVKYDEHGEIEHTDFEPTKNAAAAAKRIIEMMDELTAIRRLASAEATF